MIKRLANLEAEGRKDKAKREANSVQLLEIEEKLA
jgi:hypothetical protein